MWNNHVTVLYLYLQLLVIYPSAYMSWEHIPASVLWWGWYLENMIATHATPLGKPLHIIVDTSYFVKQTYNKRTHNINCQITPKEVNQNTLT